jgi:hypothetical protein
LKKKHELAAVLLITTLALLIILVTTYDLLYRNGGHDTSTASDSFIQQPVVDVIIPALFSQGTTGGINAPLNLTQGQSVSLKVMIYSTVSLNATMEFQVYPLAPASQNGTSVTESSSAMTWSFQPSSLQVSINGKGNTTLNLDVPQQFQTGTYSAVVSAVNSQNVAQMWGDVFQINVSK